MQNINAASLDWALEHLALEGDGDLFPRAFEIDVIKSSWPTLRQSLLSQDTATYRWNAVQNVLVL